MTRPNTEELLRLAEAVDEGAEVDWQGETTSSPEMEQTLEALKVVESVLRGYRSLSDPRSGPRRGDAADAAAAPPGAAARSVAPAEPVLFTWGRLEVREKIGRGAFGEVYRAHDPSLERDVALKLWQGSPAPGASAESFLSEARRLARVRHPNVLVVHGADAHDGQAGMWTDLIRGHTLEELLAQQGPFGPGESAVIGTELCRALAAMHTADLVHRDVKTTNVMREQGGRIVLMDFGAVAELTPLGSVDLDEPALGTPLTLAPEQLLGTPASPSTDLYSLGVLLYRLLTVRYPVEAKSMKDLADRHRRGERMPLRELRPDLPTRFVLAVERALEPDVAERYRSAAAMERALASAPGARVHPAKPAPARPTRAHEPAEPRLPPHNVPVSLLGFSGREQELDACTRMLRSCRWLDLVGPADCGKTRVALGLAEALLEQFSDGVWFVELGRLGRGDRVADAIAATAGIPMESGRSSADAIAGRWQSARVLLVLDSCDDVLEETATTGADLLRHCPKIQVIATSRTPIGVPGAEVYGVPARPEPSDLSATAGEELLEVASVTATLARVPFIGREKELTLLEESLELARRGAGRTILLGGEAGIGKSRLLAEFRVHAEARHVLCLHGRCAFHGGRNFEPFVEALEGFARRIHPPATEVSVESSRGRPALGALFSMLNMLLDPGTHLTVKPRTREQVWYLLDALLKRMAQHETLVLFLDDLHWADEGTLSLLNHVSRGIGNSRLLMVGTYRPEELGAPGTEPEQSLEEVIRLLSPIPAFFRLLLPPLDAAETTGLLERTLEGSAVGRELASTIHERAQGNPFFTIEIVRYLMGRDEHDRSGSAHEGGALVLPQTVTDVLMRRLARLSAEERDVLDLAAVEGESFHADTIETGTGLNRLALLKRLRGIERVHQLVVSVEGGYRFAHGLIREVLLREMPAELRRECHSIVATHLMKASGTRPDYFGQIGYQLYEAERFEEAMPFLIGAAQEARRLFLNDRALGYLERALEAHGRAAAPAARRGEILRSQCEVLLLLGRPEAARTAAEQSSALEEPSGDTTGRAAAQESLGEAALAQGDLVAAEGFLSSARERYAALGDTRHVARCEHKLGALAARRGDFDQGRARLETALEAFNAIGEPLEMSRIRLDLGELLARRGDFPTALATFETAVDDSRRLGERHDYARALNRLGNALFQSGRTEQALARYEEALAPTIELGDLQGMARLKANLGNVHLVRGDSERALESYLEALKRFEEIGDRAGVAQALVALGNLHFSRGDFEDAARYYGSSLGPREEMRDRWGLANSLDNLGVVEYQLGRWAEALAHQREALRHRTELGDRPGCAESALNLGNLMAVLGDLEEAENMYAEADRRAAEVGDPRRRARVLLSRACLRIWAGDRAGAAELLAAVRALSIDESSIRVRLLLLEGVLDSTSNPDASEAALIEALAETRRTGSIPEEAAVRLVAAELCARTGRAREASDHAAQALVLAGGGRLPLLELHAMRLRSSLLNDAFAEPEPVLLIAETRVRELVAQLTGRLPDGLRIRPDFDQPIFPLP